MTDQEMEHYKALGEHYNNAYSVGDMPEYTVTTTCDGCKHKQEWISVEDRLPEEYGEYMITWVSDQTNKPLISIAEYDITNDFDYENFRFLGEWLFDEYMSAYTNIKVTAWCELPEPYKGDKESK